MCEGRTCASSPSQMNAAFSKDYFKNHSFNLNFWVLVPFFLLIFQSILRYGMPIWFWKMVLSWEKITFQFSNTVFSWKKWPSKFQKWFCHEKKPLFNFQTRFFHEKNGRPILNISVRPWRKRLFHFKPIGNLAGNRINNSAASLSVTIRIHGLTHASVGLRVI